MNPRLPCLAILALTLSFFACGGSVPRPDGGVSVCDPDEERFIPVRVVDANGDPVPEATVTAKNISTGRTVTAVTNQEGTSAAVGSGIGSGTVIFSATKGSKTSHTAQANFVCGECGCSFDPVSITLTLNP